MVADEVAMRGELLESPKNLLVRARNEFLNEIGCEDAEVEDALEQLAVARCEVEWEREFFRLHGHVCVLLSAFCSSRGRVY